jgi:hypothetical protein
MSVIAKKLTAEELDNVKKLRQEYSEIIFSIGEAEIQKRKLLSVYDQLEEKEIKLASQLQEKYGEGNIDLETGEIKP